jgi:hypothetical protein
MAVALCRWSYSLPKVSPQQYVLNKHPMENRNSPTITIPSHLLYARFVFARMPIMYHMWSSMRRLLGETIKKQAYNTKQQRFIQQSSSPQEERFDTTSPGANLCIRFLPEDEGNFETVLVVMLKLKQCNTCNNTVEQC